MLQKKAYVFLVVLIMMLPLYGIVSHGAEASISVDEVKFFSKGEQIYTICDKEIYPSIYFSNTSEKDVNIHIINASYNGNRLSDIDIETVTVSANAKREKKEMGAVSVSKSDNIYKTLVWENIENAKPIGQANLTEVSCAKEIKSLSVSISGNDFIGYVNNETKKISFFIPTQYAYSAFSDVTDEVAMSYLCATPSAFESVIKEGIEPKFEGLGKIEKVSGDNDSDVLYKVTADDGSSVNYEVEYIPTKTRMQHMLSNSNVKLSSIGMPNNNSRLGGGSWGWVTADASEYFTTSLTENPKSFRATKTSKSGNGGFYTCSAFKYSVFGFAKRAIIDIDMRILELGDGEGMCMSFFSTEQDTTKNSNLIFKKVPGKGEAELYWSRLGMLNGEKIEGAQNISLGEFHNVRIVRTMNQTKLSDGKYKGVVDLYIDYKLVGSFVDTNYITFNGETDSSPSVRHNAAYNHVTFCSAAEGEESGTTFTLDIKKLDVQAEMYKDRERSDGLYEVLGKFDEKFDMDFLYWLSSLYDKESGGFYHSASARDYPGYYTDIESTSSVIDTIKRLNLWDSEAISEGMIPDWFIDNLANFAIERQNPDDGYFYDPQWGYDLNDMKKDRSLYQAQGIIAVKEGAVPKYKLPSERTAELTAFLMGTDDRFASEENCRAWAENLWNTSSTKYEAISNIAASWSLVEGAGYEEVIRDFLRGKQNPDTGLFGEGYTTDALNAAMKAGCAFDSPKAPYPRYEKVLESIRIITAANKPANAPEVWNPLSLVNEVIYSNSLNLTIEEYEKLDASIESLYKVIYGYFSEFFQSDCGASTYREGSSITGADATAVNLCIGGREGDVAGSNMLLRTKNEAYSVAGVAEPKLFTKEQKKAFWDLIRNAKPVVKKDESQLWYSISDDFEGYADKELLDNWRIIKRQDTNVYVDKKDTGSTNPQNNCMRFHCGQNGGNTYLSRHCFTPENYKTVVTKFDIFIDNNGAYFNAGVGTGHKEMFSAFQYIIDARNKQVAKIYTVTGTGGNQIMTLQLNKWYKFEIRYTPDESDNVVEFYVDGQKMYSGNDYYNMGIENRKPTKIVDGVSFMKYHASTGSIYIDNLDYHYEN